MEKIIEHLGRKIETGQNWIDSSMAREGILHQRQGLTERTLIRALKAVSIVRSALNMPELVEAVQRRPTALSTRRRVQDAQTGVVVETSGEATPYPTWVKVIEGIELRRASAQAEATGLGGRTEISGGQGGVIARSRAGLGGKASSMVVVEFGPGRVTEIRFD